MRVAGSNASYKHVVKSAFPLGRRSTKFRSTFSSTSTTKNSYDDQEKVYTSGRPNVELPPPNPHARNIAILGGGLTGLSTAFYLRQQLPRAKITIYEKSHRVGGWVDSEVVKVDGGEVLFEWGPRTIRSGGVPSTAMTLMICELGLTNDLVVTPKDAPAARNRYIYYPDHLVKMPTAIKNSSFSEILQSVRTLVNEPVFDGLWRAGSEPWVPIREEGTKDESLGDLISRRFGKAMADNLVSAVCHGIYAGDIYQLSARTIQPLLWHLETRDREGGAGIVLEMVSDMINRRVTVQQASLRFIDRLRLSCESRETYPRRLPKRPAWKPLSVYTFKSGLGQLTSTLAQRLRQDENVELLESTTVGDVTLAKGQNQIEVSHARNGPASNVTSKFDYVVSTLTPRHMQQSLLANSTRNSTGPMDKKLSTALEHSSAAVTVMVVNLYYSNPNLLSVRGFGYLIPRSVPIEQNPERGLGVIFSSETSGCSHPVPRRPGPFYYTECEWDESVNAIGLASPAESGPDPESNASSEVVVQDTAPGTKLTVMLGGHWWNGWAEGDLPSEQQGIDMAQSLLERHLRIQERPVVASARLNRQCIPQYPVGYMEDMSIINDTLANAYLGRVKVAGPWWQGSPGMNNCVMSALETAWAIRDGKDYWTSWGSHRTDEWFVRDVATGVGIVEHTR